MATSTRIPAHARGWLSATLALALCACSSNSGSHVTGSGGSSSTSGTGGTVASGGKASGSGGAAGGGGSSSAGGGAQGQGGTTGSGGAPSSGGTSGTGGASTTNSGGSGGRTGSGGASASGGATASGGTTGSGGAIGAGGSIITGGRAGTGGSTSGGGVTGSGGAIAMGGATATGGVPGTGGSTSGLAASYYIGADISDQETQPAASRANLLTLMKAHGFNSVRLRTFVDPKAADGYDKTNGYDDLAHTIAFGKQVKDAGMGLLVDFHYSDNWADPGKQCVPVAWQSYTTIADLATAVHDYTKDAITQAHRGRRPARHGADRKRGHARACSSTSATAADCRWRAPPGTTGSTALFTFGRSRTRPRPLRGGPRRAAGPIWGNC